MFVNAIMYYKVANAIHAVANVDDYSGSARQDTQDGELLRLLCILFVILILFLPQTAGCDHSAECAGHNEPRGDSLSERVHSQGDEGKKDLEAKPGNSHHNSMSLSF